MRKITLRLLVGCVIAGTVVSDAVAAIHVWVSSDGDFSAATSWSTGKAPDQWLPTDQVLFSGTDDTSVSSGLDQASVQVALVFVDSNYDGDLGADGNPLRIGADVSIYGGEGGAWFSGPLSSRFNMLVIDDPSLHGDIFVSGDYDYVALKAGYTTILSGATIDTLVTGSVSGLSPVVTIQAGPSIRNITGGGWQITNHRTVATGHTLEVISGEFRQQAIMETRSHLKVHGGSFIYTPNVAPPEPGPFADLLGGSSNFTGTFYTPHFAFGVISSLAFSANQSPAAMGLIDLRSAFPSTSFLDYGDSDDDAVPNLFDECTDTPFGVSVDDKGRPRADLNHDCRVDLRDYAIMQRDIFGP